MFILPHFNTVVRKVLLGTGKRFIPCFCLSVCSVIQSSGISTNLSSLYIVLKIHTEENCLLKNCKILHVILTNLFIIIARRSTQIYALYLFL